MSRCSQVVSFLFRWLFYCCYYSRISFYCITTDAYDPGCVM